MIDPGRQIKKKTLRIAHFGNKKIFERSGGVEVVVAEIASRQAALGHDVTVYNRKGHHVSGAEFDMDNIKEWEGVHMKYVPTIPKMGLAAVSSSFFAALCCGFRKYDIVHIHAEGPSGSLNYLKKKWCATIMELNGRGASGREDWARNS